MKCLQRLAILATIVAAGCRSNNSTIVSTFEDTISGQKVIRGRHSQIHATSVNGLLPINEVGELFLVPNKRGILSSIGISSATNWQSVNTVTYKRVSQFDPGASLLELKGLQDQVEKAAELRLKALLLDVEITKASNNDKVELRKQLESINTNLDQLIKANKASCPKNTIGFRWSAKKSKSGKLSLGELFTGSGDSESSLSGYALVSGLRVSKIYVGSDLLNDSKMVIEALEKADAKLLYIPTLIVEAQNVVYLGESELKRKIAAKAAFAISEITGNPKILQEIDKVKIDIAVSDAISSVNFGYVKKPDLEKIEEIPMRTNLTTNSLSDGWVTIFSVATSIRDIGKK